MAIKINNPEAWNTTNYYSIAHDGSLSQDHPANKFIIKYGNQATRILDFGCGDGTRLGLFKNNASLKVGVDVSKKAIELASKQYPSFDFYKIKDKIPFPDQYFDFVFSAFVLEHTHDPTIYLNEALRVLSKHGKLLIVAPNFGSPNRTSPNNPINRLFKLFYGIKRDTEMIFEKGSSKLNWKKVIPMMEYNIIDADTTTEPYLLTLENFFKSFNLRIINKSSLWDMETHLSLFQFPFRILGILGMYPFLYWGPHILIVVEKI